MPRNKLPEKTRQEMFAHWVQTNNYRETAKAFGCSDNTVKNVVRDMPEYYAREHENQRMQFVREAWLLARKALREIERRLGDADLKDVSVSFGIISQRATNAMYAAQKSNIQNVLIQNHQEHSTRLLTANELAEAIRQAKREMELGIIDEDRPQRIAAAYEAYSKSNG